MEWMGWGVKSEVSEGWARSRQGAGRAKGIGERRKGNGLKLGNAIW